jgi:hypothetical protein
MLYGKTHSVSMELCAGFYDPELAPRLVEEDASLDRNPRVIDSYASQRRRVPGIETGRGMVVDDMV